ncbi:MAG: DUF192 domain-containing protein [Gammaproteobacteria bacterium]
MGLLIGLIGLSAIAYAQNDVGQEAELHWRTVPLRIGHQTISVEVADTQSLRQRGLMYRTSLAAGTGMLFIFPQDYNRRLCFWMRNTYVPLDIAFIRDDGRIVQVESMAPRSDQQHCSRRVLTYALELPWGWLASEGLGVGDFVRGL